MSKTILVDIDHTLSAAWSRDPLIGSCGGWDAYHTASKHDEPIHDVRMLVNDLAKAGWLIIGLTARPEKWRSLTTQWLVRHSITMDGHLAEAAGTERTSQIAPRATQNITHAQWRRLLGGWMATGRRRYLGL